MQTKHSTFYYITWSIFTFSIGFAFMGIGFKSSEKIFAYTTPTDAANTSISSISTETSTSINLPPLSLGNQDFQEIVHDVFIEKYLTASAYQSSLPVTLIDTETFNKGSCPISNTDEYPRYRTQDMSKNLKNYIPSYLVEIQNEIPTKQNRVICLDETAAFYLDQMIDDARADGHDIVVTSGFRDYDTQQILYNRSIQKNPNAEYLHVAEPGHSEHQLGLAIDLAGASMNYDSASSAFGDTPEGLWLQEHAGSYGFIMSYQKNTEEETGIIYEPWHWKFVGQSL